jgi:hypothetical protein
VLQDYDLTPVRKRLVKDAAMPSGWLDEAIFEFRRYLGLRIVARGPVHMFSKQIDDVWHTCLLFSRLYADLCHQAFGHFVHHEPVTDDPPGDDAPSDPHDHWREFEAAYEGLYGELNRLWLMGRPRAAAPDAEPAAAAGPTRAG